MHRRKWDAKTKAYSVLKGLQDKPVVEICHEHQINQPQYCQWHHQFLAHVAHAFEAHQHTRTEAHLTQENAQLKSSWENCPSI